MAYVNPKDFTNRTDSAAIYVRSFLIPADYPQASSTLYQGYLAWAKGNNLDSCSQNVFSRTITIAFGKSGRSVRKGSQVSSGVMARFKTPQP